MSSRLRTIKLLAISSIVVFVRLSYAASSPKDQLLKADLTLKDAGMNDDTNLDQIRTIIQQLGVEFGPDTFYKFWESGFSMNYLYHTLAQENFNCRDEQPIHIILFKKLVDKEPDSFSRALRTYINDAYFRITQHCVQTLSKNNWSPMEELLVLDDYKNDADIIDVMLAGNSANDLSNFASRFYERLVKRMEFAASESQVAAWRQIDALRHAKVFVDEIFVYLGDPIPTEKFSPRIERFYEASQIWRHLERNFILDLGSFWIGKSEEDLELVRKLSSSGALLESSIEEAAKEVNSSSDQLKLRLMQTCKPRDERTRALMHLVGLGLTRLLQCRKSDLSSVQMAEFCELLQADG